MQLILRRRAVVGCLLLPAFCLLLSGCKVEREIERAMGALSAFVVENLFLLNNDPLLNELVSQVGKLEADVSGRKDVPYQFRILDTDEVNALAVPFGKIYVFRGLLDFVETEDELAAILGHEVGHIADKHAIKILERDVIASIVSELALSADETASLMGGLAYNFISLHFSREQEAESDRRAVEYAMLSGYDPQGAVQFFDHLFSLQGRRKPSMFEVFLSTHPPTHERLRDVKKLAANLGKVKKGVTVADAHTRIADGYRRRFLLRQAAEHYRLALAQNPHLLPARLGFAHTLEWLGNFKEAHTQFQNALDIDPQNKEAKEGLLRLKGKLNSPKSSAPSPSQESETLLELQNQLSKARSELSEFKEEVRRQKEKTLDAYARLFNDLRLTSQMLSSAYVKLLASARTNPRLLARDLRAQAGAEMSTALLTLQGLISSGEAVAERAEETVLSFEQALSSLEMSIRSGRAGQLALEEAKRSLECLSMAKSDTQELLREAKALREQTESVQRLAVPLANRLLVSAFHERHRPTMNRDLRPSSLIPPRWLMSWRTEFSLMARQLQKVKEHARSLRQKQSGARLWALQSQVSALFVEEWLREDIGTLASRLAGLFAYHLRCKPEQVEAVYSKVKNYGDTAAVLGAAKLLRLTPDTVVRLIPQDKDIVWLLRQRGVDAGGLNVWLKLMVNAWAKDLTSYRHSSGF